VGHPPITQMAQIIFQDGVCFCGLGALREFIAPFASFFDDRVFPHVSPP